MNNVAEKNLTKLEPIHILVVDDDDGIRDLIKMTLELEGYSVAVAANGRDALDRIADERPMVVLLDLMMPIMTGWEVLARLRTSGLGIPVVFMTAGFRANSEAERHHADGHLAKPFDIDDLLSVVERFTHEGDR